MIKQRVKVISYIKNFDKTTNGNEEMMVPLRNGGKSSLYQAIDWRRAGHVHTSFYFLSAYLLIR